MEQGSISIKGLDKAAVLAALYNASFQQGMGVLHEKGARGNTMSIEEAREELEKHRVVRGIPPRERIYIDYLNGRVMKVDLTDNEFDPYLYDRDNGEGAAERALKELIEERNKA